MAGSDGAIVAPAMIVIVAAKSSVADPRRVVFGSAMVVGTCEVFHFSLRTFEPRMHE
jgi:hypothetical protein